MSVGVAIRFDNPRARGAIVIVVRVLKAAVAGYDLVVELADGIDWSKAARLVPLWKQSRLAPVATHQAAKEMPFIRAIHGLVQSVGSCSQVDGRTDRGNGLQGIVLAPFTGELKDEVPAHRVAHQGDAFNAASFV